MTFYDCHTHIMNMDDVPDGFLGFRLDIPDKLILWASKRLSWLIPSSEDKLENVSAFLKNLTQTPQENYNELASCYREHENVSITILTMDLQSVYGEARNRYRGQLDSVLKFKSHAGNNPDGTPKIKVFMFMDPNASYYNRLLYTYFEKVDGIKIYPPLEAKPNHPKFEEMFSLCAKYNKPITTHCGNSGISAPTFLRRTGHLAHPKYWESVLRKHPKLTVNFAHFGAGDESWESFIIDLMKKYPNIYTDTSYSCATDSRMSRYKLWLEKEPILRDRLLFGTDHYMVSVCNKDIVDNVSRVRKFIGEYNFVLATEVNPAKFYRTVGGV